eukprot:10543510-Heterocapsa_arctica.AAC.1
MGHACGLTGQPWAEAWLQARRDEGLIVNRGVPLMPAPSVEGGWTNRPVGTEEAGVWLRQVLAEAGVD